MTLAQRPRYASPTPGENTPELVEGYARIAEVDVEQAHRKSQPGRQLEAVRIGMRGHATSRCGLDKELQLCNNVCRMFGLS